MSNYLIIQVVTLRAHKRHAAIVVRSVLHSSRVLHLPPHGKLVQLAPDIYNSNNTDRCLETPK